MKRQDITKWARRILFIVCEIFLLAVSFAIDRSVHEKIVTFSMFSVLLLFIFFWLSSLITCIFQKHNPYRWRDTLIILVFNLFGAVYFQRARQIRDYQPPENPEIFRHNFTKWLDKNHFSLEKCIEQRENAATFGAVMGVLMVIVIMLSQGLKHALFFTPDWLNPFAFILPMLGLLAFFIKHVYKDWKRTDHIPFLLGMMFLQADAGNNAKGMMFINQQEPYYKKPPLSFILMGDFFLFLSIMFGISAFGDISGETQQQTIYLRTGGITLTFLFLLISFQFQTTWFIYFHPASIFTVIKHYRAWKTASSIIALLPLSGFTFMYILLSIQELSR